MSPSTLASPSRRRFVAICGAAAGLCLPGPRSRAAAATDGVLVPWRGHALGAAATMQIHHHDAVAARGAIVAARDEVERLERIFSLHRADSALVELNRSGVLVSPPSDLVAVLRRCEDVHHASAGRFDPSVQVLWRLQARHFAQPDADPAGPPAALVEAALACVDFGAVRVSSAAIVLQRRGMALTLDGIAQGYVTDRVAERLRALGVTRSWVEMGEGYALGPRPDGQAWEVELAQGASDAPPRRLLLTDEAVSTSSAQALRFDAEGRFDTLIDPRDGGAPRHWQSVTVVARDATSADALSTAACLLGPEEIPNLLRAGAPDARIAACRPRQRTG